MNADMTQDTQMHASVREPQTVPEIMARIGKAARAAALTLSVAPAAQKSLAL